MVRYTLRLAGPEDERPVPLTAPLIANLFETLDKGSRGAVRLRLQGRSFAGGQQAAWISRAAMFRLDDVDSNQSLLHLSAPSLSEAIPMDSPHRDLLVPADAGKSGLALMSEGLQDALQGTLGADTYDAGLVDAFQKFRTVFNQGVTGLTLQNGSVSSPRIELAPDSIESLSELRPPTFEPREVRIAGKVETITHTTRAFTLELAAGTRVRGVLEEGDAADLSAYFGKKAVVTGRALFRPSGSLLRIDAMRLDPANDADVAMWGVIPRPIELAARQGDFLADQGARTGVNAAFGKWPVETTAEETNAAIDFLTRSP